MLNENDYCDVMTWLRRSRHLYDDIRLLKRELNQLNEQKLSLGGFSFEERVQHSGNGEAAYVNIVNMIADREAELRERMADQAGTLIEISRAIDRISDPRIAHAMKWRYIFNASIEQTAIEMRYSISQTKRLLNIGAEKIFYIIKNEPK